MKDWYLRQSPRDRLIVVCVGFLCLTGAAYALLWHPLNNNMQNRRQAIVTAGETLGFMQTGAVRLDAAGGQPSVPAEVSNKAPFLLIDEILKKHQAGRPKSIRPNRENTGARVDYDRVAFDQLVKAVAELEHLGLSVNDMNITRKDDPGIVSARFTIERS